MSEETASFPDSDNGASDRSQAPLGYVRLETGEVVPILKTLWPSLVLTSVILVAATVVAHVIGGVFFY